MAEGLNARVDGRQKSAVSGPHRTLRGGMSPRVGNIGYWIALQQIAQGLLSFGIYPGEWAYVFIRSYGNRFLESAVLLGKAITVRCMGARGTEKGQVRNRRQVRECSKTGVEYGSQQSTVQGTWGDRSGHQLKKTQKS